MVSGRTLGDAVYTAVIAPNKWADYTVGIHYSGYSLQWGCSGRGVQWMGAVLHNQVVYSII